MVAANTTGTCHSPWSRPSTEKSPRVSRPSSSGRTWNIVQPEYVDWTEDQEQYPFVMVAQGGWDLTTSVTPPEGFVPDEPAIAASVTDATTAVQFTMTDVGSEWTETTVNHSIVHNGETLSATVTIPMIRQEGDDGPQRQPQGDARQLGDHARRPGQRQGQPPEEAATSRVTRLSTEPWCSPTTA